MAEVEELLDDVTVRMPSGAELRARGERRTARRRVAGGVAVAVAVTGALTWGVASGGIGGDGREVRPAATPTANPFKVGGVVRLLSPELMPQAAKWRWKSMEEEVMVDLPLPKVGGDDSCPGSDPGRKAPSQVQYGTEYYGDKGATARQRVTEYDSESVAADEVSLLRAALTECGLREHAAGPDPYWSGTTESSSRLRVSVERWRGWVSVVEIEVEGRRG
ncbi:hypothetical protein GCM10009837_63590 [Streptomyces durmitorensis]|uniref:PASTA domain-containing protein n=1 Tax=Streptomyces durmitorensis TaxID=319947 RepID=A0ABY4PTG5_9ACTN|nr:hypothetical protein [Streptomyces durmitorensis]UQT56494.1 hypothetical protein M4V62_16090 [Streptomyces durmitorensis]